MAKVVLHGNLEKYGKEFNLAVYHATDAIRCLCAQLKGFQKDFVTGSYILMRKGTTEEELSLETLRLRLTDNNELHIFPVLAGAGRGTGKIILGAVLIAAAFIAAPSIAIAGVVETGPIMSATAVTVAGSAITYAQIAGFGLAMVLGGVSQMLTANRVTNSRSTAAETNASFLFNGATNTNAQGSARPLLYGRFTCGSIVSSSALTVEEYNG